MTRFIVTFFLVVMFVGVITSKAQADDKSLFPLIEGYWELVYVKDVELVKDGLHLDVFNGKNTKPVFGNLGFNSFTGRVEITPREEKSFVFEELNGIVFSIQVSKMSAESDLMDFEKSYSDAIDAVREYRIFNDDLIFLSESEEEILRYRRYKEGAPKRLIVNSTSSRVYENINMGGEDGSGRRERVSIEAIEHEDESLQFHGEMQDREKE